MHANDFNIFEVFFCSNTRLQFGHYFLQGKVVHGRAKVTIVGGRIAWQNNNLDVQPGSGRFIPLPPHSPYVFATHATRESVSKLWFCV